MESDTGEIWRDVKRRVGAVDTPMTKAVFGMVGFRRASNRGQRFDGGKLLDIGTGPIEAEVIHARIAIKTDRKDLRVWSVNSEGFYVGKLDTTYEDGWLKFHIGPHYPGLYYLIMEE